MTNYSGQPCCPGAWKGVDCTGERGWWWCVCVRVCGKGGGGASRDRGSERERQRQSHRERERRGRGLWDGARGWSVRERLVFTQPARPLRHQRLFRCTRCSAMGERNRERRRGTGKQVVLAMLLQGLWLQQVAAVPMRQARQPERAFSLRGNVADRGMWTAGAALRRALQSPANADGPCTKVYNDVKAREAAEDWGSLPNGIRGVKCDESGLFLPVQHWYGTGESWCVDVNTNEEIKGTRQGPTAPMLTPEACLAAANPPAGEIPLHGSCQTNDIRNYLQRHGVAAAASACDDACWWNHCRSREHGYCQTCMDGLSCEASLTVKEGFMLGSCEAKADGSSDDTASGPASCQDDPGNLLQWFSSTPLKNCGFVRSFGACSQDLGFMFPLLTQRIFKTDSIIASEVCPLSCDVQRCRPGTTTDADTDDAAAPATLPATLPAELRLASLAAQADAFVQTGRQVAKQSCFGCWNESTHSCARADPTDPDFTRQVEDSRAQDCAAEGGLWRSPPRIPGG